MTIFSKKDNIQRTLSLAHTDPSIKWEGYMRDLTSHCGALTISHLKNKNPLLDHFLENKESGEYLKFFKNPTSDFCGSLALEVLTTRGELYTRNLVKIINEWFLERESGFCPPRFGLFDNGKYLFVLWEKNGPGGGKPRKFKKAA